MRKHFAYYITCIFCMIICVCSGCKKYNWTSEDPDISITIYGNVSDAESGDALSNVAISALTADGLGGTAGKSVTGSDGNYEMTVNASSFTNIIRAEKAKYETTETKIEMSGSWQKDQKYKVDIQMHKNAVIYKGTIKDAQGYPLADAKVNIYYRRSGSYRDEGIASAFSDEYGKYMVEAPRISDNTEESDSGQQKNWTNKIEASKNGYTTQTQSVNHTVTDLGKTYTINFTLSPK